MCILFPKQTFRMQNARTLFHSISYLQYPLMLAGVFFAIRPYLNGFEQVLDDLNTTLVFMGLGISFSTLQDTTKTQNKLSKRVWEDPKKGRRFLTLMSVTILFILCVGMYAYFAAPEKGIRQLAFGFIVMGIGMIGMLKAGVEMAEYHSKKAE